MRRLTRRRQVKKRSKHSRNNKYNKTRRGKYIKKRRGVTRRRVLRGGDELRKKLIIETITKAIATSSPDRFRLLVNGLELEPTILSDPHLQTAYMRMIELSYSGVATGYLNLTGLKFLNYLWARVKKLRKVSFRYKNLQTAISLMDQNAIALGITRVQLPTIQNLAPDPYYYDCYANLFNFLSHEMDVDVRNIPVSSSACHMNNQCGTGDDSCDSDGECCIPEF